MCFTDVETRYRRSHMCFENAYHAEAEYNFRQQGLQRGVVLDSRDLRCLESDRLEESSEGSTLDGGAISCFAPEWGGICIR